jgi:dienelactone hydrolase
MTGMAETPPHPSEAAFVFETDAVGLDVRRRSTYDLWVAPADAVVPLVIVVHGPVRDGPRPREWPVYRGYGSLLARAGCAAAIVDLEYTNVEELSTPIAQLDEVTEAARNEPGVDGTRGLIWAFSGGARLVPRWIEAPPSWLRGVSLTYPVVPPVSRTQVPIVLTRVGLERSALQETVDRLTATATDVEIIQVTNGHHGFDALDHNDESRRAVTEGVAAVSRLLA